MYIQLNLMPLANSLNVKWWYLYNPDGKPFSEIMPVCQLLKMDDKMCAIRVIGDIANREVPPEYLGQMRLVRPYDVQAFIRLFDVPFDQIVFWRQAL